jgi:hypothetical protein
VVVSGNMLRKQCPGRKMMWTGGGVVRETRRMTEKLVGYVEGLLNKICRLGVEVFKVLRCHEMDAVRKREMSDHGDVVKQKFV